MSNDLASLTLGPMFIGLIFNILLYGIMIMQIFMYYSSYKSDKTWLKLFVALLLFADTVNSALDVAFVYVPLVTGFGDINGLEYASWLFATEPAMTVIIAMMVQMFFAWRVKVLTDNIPLVCFIVFCSISQTCGGLGTSIAIGRVPEYTHFQQFESIVIVWIVSAVLTDTVITIALVWRLKTHQSGFPATTDRLNRIIRLTVQTGLITTIVEITHLILFLTDATALHLIFNIPLAKLYTNSLMSSLNARTGWKYSDTSDANVGSLATRDKNTIQFSTGTRRVGTQFQSAPEVYIDIEAHEMHDVSDTKQSLPASTESVLEESVHKVIAR